MDTNLEATIDQIFAHLKQLGAPIAERRRVGVPPLEIESQIRSLGLQPPEDLLRLYAACDGIATNAGERLGEIQFFPGFYWMSMSEAVTVYNSICSGEQWDRSWFPIFGNGGGDFYAVICDRKSSYFGEIVGFILGEFEQIVEFKSISSLFLVIERSFSQNVFYFSGDRIEADYSAMRVIAKNIQSNFNEHTV